MRRSIVLGLGVALGGGCEDPPCPDDVSDCGPMFPAPAGPIAVGPAVTKALVGKAFTFASGVKELGTTAATTLTFDSERSAKIASTGKTATTSVRFGSCIFTPTSCVPSCPGALKVGQEAIADPCRLKVDVPSGTGTLTLGINSSSPVPIGKVGIRCTNTLCTVTIDDVEVGAFPVPTGATGG